MHRMMNLHLTIGRGRFESKGALNEPRSRSAEEIEYEGTMVEGGCKGLRRRRAGHRFCADSLARRNSRPDNCCRERSQLPRSLDFHGTAHTPASKESWPVISGISLLNACHMGHDPRIARPERMERTVAQFDPRALLRCLGRMVVEEVD